MHHPEDVFDSHSTGEYSGIDEGWWSSILADEKYYLDKKSTPEKIITSSTSSKVDWDWALKLFEEERIVELEVYSFNRGGLLVSGNGIQGFVPISHLVGVQCDLGEEERKAFLENYVGATLRLKVIECEPKFDRVVFSERAALAGEGCRRELLKRIKIGDRVRGVVTNITDFGVFVDLGGIEGLIHVSELSWGRVAHPSKVVSIGESIDTLILQVDEEEVRVALSLKQLHANPWEGAVDKYSPGQEVDAWITSLVKYGAFAKLEDGVEGLIHVSTMNLTSEQVRLDSIFTPGQKVRVQILHIDPDKRRLGLSIIW